MRITPVCASTALVFDIAIGDANVIGVHSDLCIGLRDGDSRQDTNEANVLAVDMMI
jgi:hypothetical protein